MICRDCGHENPEGSVECQRCRASLAGRADISRDGTLATPPGPAGGGAGHGETVGLAPGGTAGWSDPVQAGGAGASSIGATGFAEGARVAGRYEIVRLLGEGGMGAVYQARDLELERAVALKVIRPELATHPAILARFKQELILAREVTHPNVVRIFDLGTDGGVKFITMEFVAGRDLKSLLLAGRRFTTDETVSIIGQVCEALRAAHAASIVHRDLKPHNVMLDGEGRAKVMDFGVARSLDATGLTHTGQLIGTPDYMSPEQAKGEPIDARSDLFSLGIILYEMLVGALPYQAETAFAAILKRTQAPPVAPIKREPSVPKFLNDIAVKCLQIAPELRYASAQEILDDLAARRASPLAAPLTLLRHRLRRSRVAGWAPLVLVAGALAVGAYFALARRSSTPGAPVAAADAVGLAILPFRNTTGDASIDWPLAEMLRSDIGVSPHLRTVPLDRVRQILSDLKLGPEANLDPATIRRLSTHSNAGLVLYGQYSKLGQQIRIDATLHDVEHQRETPLNVVAEGQEGLLAAISELAGKLRGNLDLSGEAIRELEAASFRPSTESIEALGAYNKGLQAQRLGNHLAALEDFQAAIEADPGFALAEARLGQTFAALGHDDESEQAARRAVELGSTLPEYERLLVSALDATILNKVDEAIAAYERLSQAAPADTEIAFALAEQYEKNEQYAEAATELERVIASDPNYVEALYALGRVRIRSSDPQGSLDPLNRALTLNVQAENDEGRGTVLNAIGIAYMRLGKPQEALGHYEESLKIRRRLGQKAGIATSLGQIAQVQQSLGQVKESRASLEEALALRREINDRTGIADSLYALGDFHFKLGEHEEALRSYKDSLRLEHELARPTQEAQCLNDIGVVYLEQGQFADSLTYLEQALSLREKANDPYELAGTLFSLGETTAALGQYERALDHYLKALDQYRTAGDSQGRAATSHGMSVIFGRQGRYRAALESLEEARKMLDESGDRGFWRVVVTGRYGRALADLGRFDQARPALDDALALARSLQNRSWVAQVLNFRGDVEWLAGSTEAASARHREAREEATAAGDKRTALVSRLALASIALSQGHARESVTTLEALWHEADGSQLTYEALESGIRLAEARIVVGELEPARRGLEQTLNDLERSELRPLLAEAHRLLGRIERAEGDAAGAAREFAAAFKKLEEIRQEAGDDGPLQRVDLRSIQDEVGAARRTAAP